MDDARRPDPVIEEATAASRELVDALARLIPQLSSATPPNAEALGRILAAPATQLLLARIETEIVGTLTLVLVELTSGLRAHIEDVVVDSAYARRGIGEALVRAAIERAKDAGARSIELTSRPSREAANRLYARTGFVRRETNVWHVSLER